MDQSRRNRSKPRRRPPGPRQASTDIWAEAGPLPELEPIIVPSDPALLIRSLGDPPITGGVAAGHYFAAVAERAAAVATALAHSADLVERSDDR
jgi:hypothetical protein